MYVWFTLTVANAMERNVTTPSSRLSNFTACSSFSTCIMSSMALITAKKWSKGIAWNMAVMDASRRQCAQLQLFTACRVHARRAPNLAKRIRCRSELRSLADRRTEGRPRHI